MKILKATISKDIDIITTDKLQLVIRIDKEYFFIDFFDGIVFDNAESIYKAYDERRRQLL